MKILQLVTKRQFRGAEVFAANLSKELILLGHEVIFAGLYKNNEDVLSVDQAENIDISEKKTGRLSIGLIQKLAGLINIHKPDVVQCNGSDTLKYMVAASFFTPKVPIIYRNISMISNWIPNEPIRILYKNIFRRVAHVSSVGEEAAEDFIKTFNYPAAQVSVTRRGIPIKQIEGSKELSKLRSSLGFKGNEKIVTHIGNFSVEKNHDFLLDLFHEIKEENPEVKLICVGTGFLFNEIQRKIKERGLEDTIYLLGFRKDIPEILAASDCFVLSSKIEGVPGVILEAAAQKIPSVATNVGGVSEVLIDGKTGFLINDFDSRAFKTKLLELLSNENLRKEYGENAFKLVVENFHPGKNAIKFEQLYEKLVQPV